MGRQRALRYGENPHQKAWVRSEKTRDPLAFFRFKQIQGKKLSFNNYLDIDAAINCLCLVGKRLPACVVVKHTSPCGAAVAKNIEKAFTKAWKGDSLAAFGSIIAVNREVSGVLAEIMLRGNRFFEILVCPSLTKKAREVFSEKKNLRILVNPSARYPRLSGGLDFKKIRGGSLVQEQDTKLLCERDLEVVTKKKPAKKQMEDILFAWNICRISKSNAVVLAKNKQLVSSGVGQQDRLRCCKLAVDKSDGRSKSSVAASDGFFPFPDGPKVLIDAGVKAIVQPGGSIRDQETIDLCNKSGIAMVFTGVRGFKH